jgi:hypothetical protein
MLVCQDHLRRRQHSGGCIVLLCCALGYRRLLNWILSTPLKAAQKPQEHGEKAIDLPISARLWRERGY